MSDFISAVDRTLTSHRPSCSVHKLRQYEITSAWWGFCLFFSLSLPSSGLKEVSEGKSRGCPVETWQEYHPEGVEKISAT